MLYSALNTVYAENNIKQSNTLWAQGRILNIKQGSTCSNYYVLKG